MSSLTGRPNPCRETKFSGANGDREIFIFPVQLTSSRNGNLTRLIHTLLYKVMAIHTQVVVLLLLITGIKGKCCQSCDCARSRDSIWVLVLRLCVAKDEGQIVFIRFAEAYQPRELDTQKRHVHSYFLPKGRQTVSKVTPTYMHRHTSDTLV